VNGRAAGAIGPAAIERGNELEQPALGMALRRFREERGYSLAAVAGATGMSAAFLSLVEKGKSDITLGRLMRVVGFYGILLDDLLPGGRASDHEVVRAGKARHVYSVGEGVHMYMLASDGQRKMMPVLSVHDPGAHLLPLPYVAGTECFMYVIEGSILLEREGKEPIVLHEGDAAYVNREEALATTVIGDRPVRLIGVTTPAPL
jgi:transcriptional regulator with XRE-family HTH domain